MYGWDLYWALFLQSPLDLLGSLFGNAAYDPAMVQRILLMAPPACNYDHPEVDGIWIGYIGMYWGSFNDHILSTPGWLYSYQVRYE